jgi:hypothetical protein
VPAIEPNVGWVAQTVSTPSRIERLLTLRGSRSGGHG